MKAQKCPVCEGARKVPEELYTGKPTVPDPKLVKCKTCKGEGYLLVPGEDIHVYPAYPVQPIEIKPVWYDRPEVGDPINPPYRIISAPTTNLKPYWEYLPKTYC